MNRLKPKKRHKRGYPVAILVGLEEDTAVVWKIFSNVVKHERTLHINGTGSNPKDLYNFHESIITSLRPALKEGVRSIILASPARTNNNQKLINHVFEHHKWLSHGSTRAVFSKITGSASAPPDVTTLARTPIFRQLISETTEEETENLIKILEKRISTSDNNDLVLFSLKEAENIILNRQKPRRPKADYLMLTARYLAENPEKNRLQRLMQIAKNQNIKTRIIDAESPAGKRLAQLGGFVCLAQYE